jgi:hypothetical protein
VFCEQHHSTDNLPTVKTRRPMVPLRRATAEGLAYDRKVIDFEAAVNHTRMMRGLSCARWFWPNERSCHLYSGI